MDRRSFIFGLGTGLAVQTSAASAFARPHAWARPLYRDKALPNLNRVTSMLYRSGQPKRQGFIKAAHSLGIRTIVNLRNDREDTADAAGLGLHLVNVRMSAWDAADEDNPLLPRAIHEIQKGLRRGKTLVHCQYGSDRTGAVIAVWRIVAQGWDKERAINEMQAGGYGYHDLWLHLGAEIRALDIARLRRQIAAL
jgi:protein tyrosine/serine phosphatase